MLARLKRRIGVLAKPGTRPGARRTYAALILSAMIGPALLFVAFAWWGWQRVHDDATGDVTRGVATLAEQARRLVQIQDLVAQSVKSRVVGMDWDEIIRDDVRISAMLRDAAAILPEVESIYIVDSHGDPQVSSRPMRITARGTGEGLPTANMRNRDYFKAAFAGAQLVIDSPGTSRITGHRILSFVHRLDAPGGSFAGVMVITLSADLVGHAWSGIADRGDAVGLVRDDGAVLVRYPTLPPSSMLTVHDGGLLSHIRSADEGIFDVSPAFDGVARRVGFRKLAPYPLYVVYGIAEANIIADWYPMAAAFGALALAATAGLLFASLAVIRRAGSEALAHARAEHTGRALRASEEAQRTLFRKAPTAMHALDAERRLLDVSDRWLELFGYERQEVIGRSITEFYVAADDAQRAVRWQEIMQRGTVREAERQCITRSGEVFDALVSATIVRDVEGRFVRVVTLVSDVTLRRRAEAAAQHAQNFAELLIESTVDGIIVKDRELRFTVWNRGMEEITGQSRDMMLGRTAEEVLPGFVGSPVNLAWASALEGRPVSLRDQRYEFPETRRAGYFDQSIVPLRDADGAIIGVLGVVRDITERRHMEEVLRQAQKMEAVGQLTGGIAHDFNNLLTVILGNLEALQRRIGNQPELNRFADSAIQGAERAATLTSRLLAFSRRQPLDPRPLDPNRLVAGMSDLLRRALGEQVAIETVLTGGVWQVSVDSNQLESALLNLAVNARDAMPGGGRVTIGTANAALDDTYAARHEDVLPGEYAVIAVRDTGTGMDDDVKARAFEPFYTTKEAGRGSGLGLSQVYGFVTQSGGHVRIDSAPGEGTTVRLFLPRFLGEVPADAVVAPTRPLAAARDDVAVLVVEDDDQVRAHTARLLRELGYRVCEAGTGAAALLILEDERDLCLLFTDIVLAGGMNGRQLAEAARLRRPDLKILFTTGYARDTITRQGRLDPGLPLIVKPFTFAGLAAKVREILDAA